ncbi:hypothetical protein QQ054_25495 [Oscillatoria amoena NRMC-F 0135]|nr:hypothetical protein [Oscillatoria amoena NRMC-F 0135]
MRFLVHVTACVFLGSLFLLASCDDDENGIPANTIRYNGKNYKLDFGIGIDYGSFTYEEVTYSNVDFVLFDREIDLEDEDPFFSHGFYVEMYKAGSEDFTGGTFTFYDGESEPVPAGSLFTSGELFFYDDEEDPIEVAGGTITLTITGDTYNFKFNLVDEDGKKIEGNFSGEIEIFDLGAPNISGSISIDSDTRSADFGEIDDWGSTGTHYNYDFSIYDLDESYSLYFEAFSLGTSGFIPGTFTYGTTGSSYFDIIQLYDVQTATIYAAVSGSVIVTKLSGTQEYRLVFDVVLDDASSLTGTVEGNFDYYNVGGRKGDKNGRMKSSSLKPLSFFKAKKSDIRRSTR